jgi:hypothetical protein
MELINEHLLEWEEEEIFFQLLNSISSASERTARAGHRAVIHRKRLQGHTRLMKDYFIANPVYHNCMFERRFRMSKRIFDTLCQDLQQHHRFWILKAVGAFL